MKGTVVTVQRLAHRLAHGLAASEPARRVTSWERQRRWETAELKDHQQREAEDQLQRHSRLILLECTHSSLEVPDLEVHVQGT